MSIPSAFDRERLAHINHLMDTIHDSSNEIYESLVDGDIKKLNEDIAKLIFILKDINPSELGE
jgi:hypothetical protein